MANAERPSAADTPPPFRVWAIAAAFLAVAVGIGFVLQQHVERRSADILSATIDAQAAALESAGHRPPGTRLIVVIGSSLAEEAIDPEALRRTTLGGNAIIVMLTRRAPRIEWLDRLLPHIQAAHPDLVLFHIDMLEPGSDYRADIRRTLQRVVWEGLARLGVPESPCPDFTIGDVDRVIPQMLPYVSAPVRQGERPGLPLALRDADTSVAIFDIPRAAELIAAAPQIDTRRWELEEHVRPYGFDVWRRNDAMPLTLFCDARHMNGQGRALFTAWLSARISEHFGESP